MYRRVYLVGFHPHLHRKIRETALDMALPLHFFHALQGNAEPVDSAAAPLDNLLGERLRQSINQFLLGSADWVAFVLTSESEVRSLAGEIAVAAAQGKAIVFLHDSGSSASPTCLDQVACYVADDYLQLLTFLGQRSVKVAS